MARVGVAAALVLGAAGAERREVPRRDPLAGRVRVALVLARRRRRAASRSSGRTTGSPSSGSRSGRSACCAATAAGCARRGRRRPRRGWWTPGARRFRRCPPRRAVRSRNSRRERSLSIAAATLYTPGTPRVAVRLRKARTDTRGARPSCGPRCYGAARRTSRPGRSARRGCGAPRRPSRRRRRRRPSRGGGTRSSPARCGAGSRGARAPPGGSAFLVKGCWPCLEAVAAESSERWRPTPPTGRVTPAGSHATPPSSRSPPGCRACSGWCARWWRRSTSA